LLYPLSYCPVILVEQPGLEPGTHRLHVVPPAFAAGISKLATRIGESFLDPVAETSAGFEPACVFGRVPCTPTGIRQLPFKRADKEIGETLNMFGM